MEPKITLYEHISYGGRSQDFTESCPDLDEYDFDDITSSAKCNRGVWILYSEKYYQGNIFVVQDGEDYNDNLCDNFNDYASSIRLLDNFDFTEESKCTIYKDNNFLGRSLTFRDDVPNLKLFNLDDEMSSVVVKSGAWVGFTECNYEGEQSLFLSGRYIMSDLPSDEGGFINDSLSSLRKILGPSGEMKILKIDYDLDKKQTSRTPSTVFSWTQVNNTSVEQTLSEAEEITILRENTYEFKWNRGTKVPTTMTANVGIPLIGKKEVSVSPDMSVSVGSDLGTKTTKREKWVAKYPSKIPSYSTLTMTTKVTQGTVNVPFTATLYFGEGKQRTITDKDAVKMEPKITLYKNKKFGGRSKEFTKSCPDLLDAGFDDMTSSVKCERGVWILYQLKNFKGRICVIEEGEVYEKFTKYFQDRASSLKLLDDNDFTEEPECTVYADVFDGRSLTFTDDIENLKWYKFDNKMSSIEVKSGAWVGYQHPNYGGDQSLFLKGKYVSSNKPNDEGGFKNDRISSFSKIMLKPATGVNMKLLQIDYDLDRADIIRTPTSVFSWTQVNNTSVEQTVTKTDEITITREDTYEFRWDRAAKISTTMKGNVGIPLVGETEVSISAEMSVSMGRTTGTKKSKTDKWIAEYPSKIPRYSTVTVTSKLTQGNINIPFTAVLYYGDDTERTITEKGVFYGCQYFDFHTEFNESKVPT